VGVFVRNKGGPRTGAKDSGGADKGVALGGASLREHNGSSANLPRALSNKVSKIQGSLAGGGSLNAKH